MTNYVLQKESIFQEWKIDSGIINNPAFNYAHRKFNRVINDIEDTTQENFSYYGYRYNSQNNEIRIVAKKNIITYYLFNETEGKFNITRFMKKNSNLLVVKGYERYNKNADNFSLDCTYFISEYDERGIEINKRTISITPNASIHYLSFDNCCLQDTIMCHNNELLNLEIINEEMHINERNDIKYEENMYRGESLEQIICDSRAKTPYNEIMINRGYICALDYPKGLAVIPSKRKNNIHPVILTLLEYNDSINKKIENINKEHLLYELVQYKMPEETIAYITEELNLMFKEEAKIKKFDY